MTQRNWGFAHAAGSHVWCLADDDVAAPGAVDALVAAARQGGWHLFRVRSVGELGDWVVWRDRHVILGNLDAEGILVPRDVTSRWPNRYEGDFLFAELLSDELGEPTWQETVVALLRPAT
jgi:hypothetical protein